MAMPCDIRSNVPEGSPLAPGPRPLYVTHARSVCGASISPVLANRSRSSPSDLAQMHVRLNTWDVHELSTALDAGQLAYAVREGRR
jgi:hypothetical protein